MRATIIIPTYGRTAIVPDALQSVVQQEAFDDGCELLLVDNGSEPSPDLRALCGEGDSPVRYAHEPRNGLLYARHTGAQQAEGEILVYIDDDVICPPGWLSAMLMPFRDEKVAAVAGKVVLRYEGDCPEWVKRFRTALSALDFGEKGFALDASKSAHGCNMAVRKDALYRVGGFNPDCYGEPRLGPYMGDGECGLVRKIQASGGLVWYSPAAWLHHRVPPGRMTLHYHEQRARMMGIERVYRSYRYVSKAPARLVLAAANYLARWISHRLLLLATARGSESWYRHRISSVGYWESILQTFRVLTSRALRIHIASPRYL